MVRCLLFVAACCLLILGLMCRSALFVGCCALYAMCRRSLRVICCTLFVAGCLRFVVTGVWFVVLLPSTLSVSVVYYWLFLWCVVCCSLFVVGCSLNVGLCVLFVDCRCLLLFVVGCCSLVAIRRSLVIAARFVYLFVV